MVGMSEGGSWGAKRATGGREGSTSDGEGGEASFDIPLTCIVFREEE